MRPFAYHRPRRIPEAAELLSSVEDSKILAGGMTLVPTLKHRLASPAALVDLARLGNLRGIKDDGATITIGAMTPHADVAASKLVQSKIPALATLASMIGDPAVRSRGTIGGSVANNDPAADYPAGVLGLGATIVTNMRGIAADAFFLGLFETALQPGEIITAIRFPVPVQAGYAKFKAPASRYALVGVFVARFHSGVRVAVTGAGSGVFRFPRMEDALTQDFDPSAIATIKLDADGLTSDIHAEADYRAHLVTVMAKRAVQSALPGQESPIRVTHAATRGRPLAHDLATLSAAEIMAGYRRKAFTPRDVIDDVIAALEKTDAACNAVVTPMYEQARAEADRVTKEMRAGEAKGLLAGVPVTIKDLVFVAGVPAYAGSPMNKAFVPDVDAAVVSALKASGAIITCKTTTCESGYKLTADSPLTGTTRNPWNLDRTSGGSSGGAAAGVAAGCGPIAIGTDGVGSIRVPSSFCGVFGLKPTFGLVPRSPGFSPPSWASLAHTGPITRTVADAALTLEIIAGYDMRDAASLPVPSRRFDTNPASLNGIRIGASADLGYAVISPDVRAAFNKAIAVLDACGAQVTMDGPGLDPEILEHTLKPIAFTEQAAAVASKTTADLASSEADYRDVVSAGRHYSGTDYIEANYRRGQARNAFLKLFERVDALVTPTVAVTAFEAGQIGVDKIDGSQVDPHLGWSPFTWPINLAGLPAATLPCGFDRDGMPIGLQIVAPWLDEPTIFRIAAAFEQAQPWAKFWPQVALR